MAKEIRASHILVENELDAEKILAKIRSGRSFEELARQYSSCPSKKTGGDLGYFTRDNMVKEFEDVAFSAGKGEVIGPVKTQFGWHIIKVTDTKE